MLIIDRLIRFIGNFSAVILVLLILLVVYDALMRYLFHSGSIALQELEWHLFDVIILFGIAYTLQRSAHVRVDIFYEHFSIKTQAVVNMISAIFFIAPLSFLIIYVGFEFVSLSFVQQEASSNPGGLPYRFIVKSFMPIAFVLLLLQTGREIVISYTLFRDAK